MSVNDVVAYYHIHRRRQRLNRQMMYWMVFEHDNQHHQLDQRRDLYEMIGIIQVRMKSIKLPSRQHWIKKSLGLPAKYGQLTLLKRSKT